MKSASDAAGHKRAAVETYARNETALRKTARRFSLCDDDADDALQRALEILLHKAPTADPRELVKWTQTVVRHEALAIRSERERILSGPAAAADGGEDWVSLLPASSDDPAEKVERREAVARSREALQALKPQELRALTLLAEGYSYVEIGEITSWSHTKINRCLAEGRERFRSLVSRSEDGSRCVEMQPLLSAFCDGEAKGDEVAALREHLRACAHCRATLRTYRAAPAAAAALAPGLPFSRSLLERAHDAITHLAARFGGGGGDTALSQVASGGGAGGMGVAALAKVAAVCIGTAGGAAACVAGGLVPAPFGLNAEHPKPAALERKAEQSRHELVDAVDYEPAPEPVAPPPDPAPDHKQRQTESEPASAEPAPVVNEPATSSGAVEYAPPPAPEPAPEPAPAASSGGGNPAGEFGP
ncbi:MAG TPA: sigma-70 family RNA polymerase sigma factor [Solirubrobacterales bacterium]|nr:sigma-70 family RNA polymerase sigma factor [Solirubrobacterales bacterium]